MRCKIFRGLGGSREAGLDEGWIYRFFPAPAEVEAGRASPEAHPAVLLSAGSSRRSGCVPAEPYLPLKQMLTVCVASVSRFRYLGGL